MTPSGWGRRVVIVGILIYLIFLIIFPLFYSSLNSVLVIQGDPLLEYLVKK